MSVFILKLIALFFMIIDHIGHFFITNEYYALFRILGRIAAPIFLFLFVEGYLKTSNRKKYQNRLLIASTIMFIGNIILSFFCSNMYPLNTNIIFTMLLCSLFLDNIESKRNIKYKIIIGLLLLIPIYFAEYSFIALLCVIIFYLYRKEYISKILMCLIYFFTFISYCLLINNILQMFMILALIPIVLYNGKLGFKNKFMQQFYYWFYILHLWIFVIITSFM